MKFAYIDMAAAIGERSLRKMGRALIVCAVITLTGTEVHLQAAEMDVGRGPSGQEAPPFSETVPPSVGTVTVPSAGVPPRLGAQEVVSQTPARTQPDRAIAGAAEKPRAVAGRTGFVLGLSWLPAFCETRAKRPECVGQTSDRSDAKQLTLAGLWPVRNTFCKVSESLQAEDRKRDWLALPPVPLTAEVAAKLVVSMPGTASGFDRHTWLRSGSCQVLNPDAYFALQIRLLEAVNRSAVGALFRSRVGGELSEADVKAAFDQSFAAGAGDRIRIQCRQVGDRKLVTGLTIGLSATMEETSDLATLIHAAAPIRTRCDGGVVDAAGRVRAERQAVVRPAGSGANGIIDKVDVR